MKTFYFSAALGRREGFIAGYLGHVDRGEKLNTDAIKGRWWNGVLLASCMAACPFLFFISFEESMALRGAFVVMFLWSI